jgi:hypothetical protein
LDIPVSVGQEIVLKYSNHKKGFHAQIFDASGRKADELHSPDQSGEVTWGQDYKSGVYFIRIDDTGLGLNRKVILVR